jgi:hypothetical protein
MISANHLNYFRLSLLSVFLLAGSSFADTTPTKDSKQITDNRNSESPEKVSCRIGSQKIHIDRDIKSDARRNKLIAKKIQEALVLEVAQKYDISPEPEFSAAWKQELEGLGAVVHEDLTVAPPSTQAVLKKKSLELKSAVLASKVDAFIAQDLTKTDQQFSIFFSQDPAVINANQPFITSILNGEGGIAFRTQKINDWWKAFITKEDTEFNDEDCRKVFEKFREKGPK